MPPVQNINGANAPVTIIGLNTGTCAIFENGDIPNLPSLKDFVKTIKTNAVMKSLNFFLLLASTQT